MVRHQSGSRDSGHTLLELDIKSLCAKLNYCCVLAVHEIHLEFYCLPKSNTNQG